MSKNDLFIVNKKDDKVKLTFLREAIDADDLKPFFKAFDEIFSAENTSSEDKELYVFCNCERIDINPLFIRIDVVKSIFNFLVERKEILTKKIGVVAFLISSKILSLTVSALLNNLSIAKDVISLKVSHDENICKGFIKEERLSREKKAAAASAKEEENKQT
jgi:hypothetical protein